jgi:hypothetical protein
MVSKIDTTIETFEKESALMADANYSAVLSANPQEADAARKKLLGMRSALETQISQLSSYKGSSVWGDKVDTAISKANKGLERLDAAFDGDYSTEGLMKGAATATESWRQQASPAVTGQARVAGLYGSKATPETIKQGMSTLALGEGVWKGGGFITKVQAIQNPIENHNILVTGLATNVADNAADVKTNYQIYARSYINATLPYVVDIKPSNAGGKSEVRSTMDFTDSLNGLFSVTNRNDSFVDTLWNTAAEKGDKGTHEVLVATRLQSMNAYSKSAYMELIGNYPDLAEFVRPRDFIKDSQKLSNTSPLAVVGKYTAEQKARLDIAISSYNQKNSEFRTYVAKTNSYMSSLGLKIGDRDGE